MKLASYLGAGDPEATNPRVGVVEGDRVVDVTGWIEGQAGAGASRGGASMLALLDGGPSRLAALAAYLRSSGAESARRAALVLADLRLLAPVPRPGKIVAIGRNYADHAAETGVAAFEKPRIIAKLPNTVTGPGSVVPIPAGVSKLDFEIELAAVIGTRARQVPASRALEHVAGYTILDDLSAREFQFDVSPPQTTFAKSMDGFCPMGPWIVTADELGDPQALELDCELNGAQMQHASTANMIFPVARLIEYISGFVTLEPGDVIATGTPAGVGAFRKPPLYLRRGDRLRMTISRIGVLEHAIG